MTSDQNAPSTHSVSFELTSSDDIGAANQLFALLTANEDVFRISIEAEANTPFDAFSNAVTTAALENEPARATADIATADTTPQAVTEDAATVERTPTPQTETTDTPDTDESDDGVTCEYCGDPFDTESAMRGHLAWCDDYKETTSEDTDDTEDSSDDATSTESEDEDTSLENVALSSGTWKFRLASTLLNVDTPITAPEVEDHLKGTEWANSRKRLSGALATLADEGVATRSSRVVEDRGANPYEYTLTDAGRTLVEDTEQTARENGDLTFTDLQTAEPTEDQDETAEEDSVEAADTDEDEHECEECGETFPTPGALGSHRHYKHSDGEDDASLINPDTGRFRVASVIHSTAKPVIPKDIESRVEGTEWEQERSNISSVLSDLHQDGLVERERRPSQRGKPFEYELTEEGEDIIELAIEAAEEEDELTYEEVVAGK